MLRGGGGRKEGMGGGGGDKLVKSSFFLAERTIHLLPQGQFGKILELKKKKENKSMVRTE